MFYQNISDIASLSNLLASTAWTINNDINLFLKSANSKPAMAQLIFYDQPNFDLKKTTIQEFTNFTKEINLFDTNNKNISRAYINMQGAITSLVNFNFDETKTQILYNIDKTQTINQCDKQGNAIFQGNIDANGTIILITVFTPGNTQTKISYHQNKTKTIDYFNTHGRNSSRKELDSAGKTIESIIFSIDESQLITVYNLDGSQSITHIDAQGYMLSRIEIDPNGIKHHATIKLITAWHEAGHALAYIRNNTLNLVNHITIQPQEITSITGHTTKTLGHVSSTQTYRVDKSVEELENSIIAYLCGAVGEQVLMHEKMLINPQDILTFLSRTAYTRDMELARKDAQKIVTVQSFQYFTPQQIQEKVTAIIVKLYAQAYAFIINNKDDVNKLANVLMQRKTLNSDETYDLIKADKPLIRHEQGPLPLSLVNDYKYREWNNKSNYATAVA